MNKSTSKKTNSADTNEENKSQRSGFDKMILKVGMTSGIQWHFPAACEYVGGREVWKGETNGRVDDEPANKLLVVDGARAVRIKGGKHVHVLLHDLRVHVGKQCSDLGHPNDSVCLGHPDAMCVKLQLHIFVAVWGHWHLHDGSHCLAYIISIELRPAEVCSDKYTQRGQGRGGVFWNETRPNGNAVERLRAGEIFMYICWRWIRRREP